MIANDIADLLEDEGVGTVQTDIFVSALPPTPNNCIAVLDSVGSEPDPDQLFLKKPRFQILIRNESYAAGLAKLKEVRDTLHGKANVQINDTYLYYILANTEGGSLGKDENNRDEFSINFRSECR